MLKVLVLIFLPTSVLLANDLTTEKKQVKKKIENKRMRAYIYGDFLNASNDVSGESYSGLGMGLMGLYSLKKRWAFSLGIRQSFGAFGQTAASTALDARLTYVLSGHLWHEKNTATLDGKDVILEETFGVSGIRLQFISSQYSFSGTSSSTTFSGIGLAAYYEKIIDQKSYIGGVSYETVSNNSVTVTPLSVFIGIGFVL